MPIPTSFDELNRLVGYKRSMPIDKYFDEMPITTEQKRLRKAFARRLEDEMVWLMSFLFYTRDNPQYMMALEEIRERYRECADRDLLFDAYVAERINRATADIVSATSRHEDDPYFYSKDRARLISENESNTIWSYTEYENAIKNKSYKRWRTIMDGHERDSHAEVNGVVMPINEPFVLAGGLLQYPRDESYSPSDEEIIACRCGIEFF